MARLKQQLKMATQAYQPSYVKLKKKKPQGHTKRDEAMSRLPLSVTQQPVGNGKTERKRREKEAGIEAA